MSKLHKYSALWMEFPDYIFYPDSEQVKRDIGGNVNAKYITNTCVVRLSRTLNYNGFPIPRKFAGLATVKGGDGKRYALRVAEIRPWLNHRLGKPDFDVKKKAGEKFDKKRLSGMAGIIGFDIKLGDATGHFDLWGGTEFSAEYMMSKDYWVNAHRISLWQAIR